MTIKVGDRVRVVRCAGRDRVHEERVGPVTRLGCGTYGGACIGHVRDERHPEDDCCAAEVEVLVLDRDELAVEDEMEFGWRCVHVNETFLITPPFSPEAHKAICPTADRDHEVWRLVITTMWRRS